MYIRDGRPAGSGKTAAAQPKGNNTAISKPAGESAKEKPVTRASATKGGTAKEKTGTNPISQAKNHHLYKLCRCTIVGHDQRSKHQFLKVEEKHLWQARSPSPPQNGLLRSLPPLTHQQQRRRLCCQVFRNLLTSQYRQQCQYNVCRRLRLPNRQLYLEPGSLRHHRLQRY